MNKYLLSALSLMALTQVASAAEVTYHVTLENPRRDAHPPDLELKFYSRQHPAQGRGLDLSEGSHKITVHDGHYDTIELVGNERAIGWMNCTKSDGEELSIDLGGKHPPLSLSIVVKGDKHYTWLVSKCEESGG